MKMIKDTLVIIELDSVCIKYYCNHSLLIRREISKLLK